MVAARPRFLLLAGGVLLQVAGGGCGRGETPDPATPEAAGAGAPLLEDVTEAVGLVFSHYPGATGQHFFLEPVGAGAALLDYDGDGDLDLYLVQSGPVPGAPDGEPLIPLSGNTPDGNRLFRNDLVPGGALRFTDVTAEAGVGDRGYGMGVAVGDVDSDGDPDLYVTNFGTNVFYRNEGDGRFVDVTAASGADDGRWNTSAAFLDHDGDGDLDLFLTAYVTYTVKGNKTCFTNDGRRDYCGPGSFKPTPDRLFRNDGDFRFTDVSMAAGIDPVSGKGLGVTVADFDSDGRDDVYVANDQWPNHLLLNRGGGHFEETAVMAGSAYNATGEVEASMGVTAGDFDGDGDPDLFMTHLRGETNTLYLNQGDGQFFDVTDRFQLGAVSRPYTGFGTAWFDLENDGDLDLFIANGAVTLVRDAPVGEPYPYHEPNQLFLNDGGRFSDVSQTAGPAMSVAEISRGAAFGDVDNDGDTDILISNNYGPARLLLNRAADPAPSLVVTLAGTDSPRDGTGATLTLELEDGRKIRRRAGSDGSYLSAGDPRVIFGLAGLARPISLAVRWPSG
ncbi:MAG: CRTAC1 family protein, partial [Gammaproteobacteria bacterium]